MSLRAAQAGFVALACGPRSARGTAAGRRAALRKIRGGASTDVAPLLSIRKNRLDVYNELVVASFRTMIEYALGSTLAAARLLSGASRAERAALETTRLVEGFVGSKFGPKTHGLRELAAGFASYLRKRGGVAFRSSAALRDVLAFELVELAVELEVDGPGRFASAADLTALRSGTLDRLLRKRATIPTYLRILKTSSDLSEIVATLRRGDRRAALKLLRAAPQKGAVVVARDPASLKPTRHVVSLDVAKDLRSFEAGRPFRLEEYAERRARRGPKGETETEAAGRVAAEILGRLESGLLLLA